MTDLQTIQRVEAVCQKNGPISVQNIRRNGDYTLVVPVFNGETNEEQTAVFEMESSFDGESVTLYKFPKTLLTDEDYAFICDAILDVLELED